MPVLRCQGMALKRKKGSMDVVQAAQVRIRNVFANGLPVYMSFSGGKDSLALAQVVLRMIQRGDIDPHQLTVQFIDEEAIFPCIEETVKKWRKIFLASGAKFQWFCLECRHFNCFNQLENDESFILWAPEKESVWIRRPPSFAIRTHRWLHPRTDTYQMFLARANADGISIVGVRVAESLQRLQYVARITSSGRSVTKEHKAFPIYDWKDSDVWMYLQQEHVDIPDIYLYLWQSGSSRKQMRVSQFFSVDTARSLVKMNEYYPDLMDRIIAREPNAYLAALYWDSEMFGRSTSMRRELEAGRAEVRDYRTELARLFANMDTAFDTPRKKYIAIQYRKLFLKVSLIATNAELKDMYESLLAGDPKMRTLRALYVKIFGRYMGESKEAQGLGGKKWKTS